MATTWAACNIDAINAYMVREVSDVEKAVDAYDRGDKER